MKEVIIILLSLILISFLAIISGWIISNQNKKKQQVSVNIEPLQRDINSSKELLDLQVKNLKEQIEIQRTQLFGIINSFKTTWDSSDRDQRDKVTTLIKQIENFQNSLIKKEDDYKRNASEIKNQVTDVIRDLAKLQESSKDLGKISENVQNLQEIFINTKKRGNVGEYLLEKILTNMLGSNSNLWQRQYKTADNNIVDAYVRTSEEKEGIAIDSKFSFENYKKYLASEDSKIKEAHLKSFRGDIRKRIDEVAKYISIKNKISSAIMFVPSEDIFAFIYGNFSEEIVDYAFKKKVWITSPTTLAAVLFTVEKHMKDSQFNKEVEHIAKKLLLFKTDFERWVVRWELIKKEFNNTNEKIDLLDKTHNKLSAHYNSILAMSNEFKESE
ncbi:MAG: DNA recombination protein RmuC [Spiroplasma sp.]